MKNNTVFVGKVSVSWNVRQSLIFFALILCSLSTQIHSVEAQTSKAVSTASADKEKIVPGIIASYGKFRRLASVDTSSTGQAGGGANSPISASINRKGSDCNVVVKNNSIINKYSISISVEGQNKDGVKQFSRGFSLFLHPEGTKERSVRCQKDWNMAVILKRGKKR